MNNAIKTKTKINDLSECNFYLQELDEACIHNELILDNAQNSESITLVFSCDGGPYEDVMLFVRFNHVQIFHLGVSLNKHNIGVQIDELRHVSLSSLHDVMPYQIDTGIRDEFVCYRFFSRGNKTPYYVICEYVAGENIDIWLDGFLNDVYHYRQS